MPSGYISKEKFDSLNEKEKRLTAATYAMEYGYGGIVAMHEKYSISRVTIIKGIKELKSGVTCTSSDRIRVKGGGRKTKSAEYPDLEKRILELAGNPYKPELPLREIAHELDEKYGMHVGYMTVSRILEKHRA